MGRILLLLSLCLLSNCIHIPRHTTPVIISRIHPATGQAIRAIAPAAITGRMISSTIRNMANRVTRHQHRRMASQLT
jgi:hypothetical protein